jgi:hypothetical protein
MNPSEPTLPELSGGAARVSIPRLLPYDDLAPEPPAVDSPQTRTP